MTAAHTIGASSHDASQNRTRNSDIVVGVLMVVLGALALTITYLAPGWPHAVRGTAIATSGATLAIDGVNLQLIGIESDTAAGLAEHIDGAITECYWRGDYTDRATCQVGGRNLALVMLQSGDARFSGDAANHEQYESFLRAEFAARRRHVGIWGGPQSAR